LYTAPYLEMCRTKRAASLKRGKGTIVTLSRSPSEELKAKDLESVCMAARLHDCDPCSAGCFGVPQLRTRFIIASPTCDHTMIVSVSSGFLLGALGIAVL